MPSHNKKYSFLENALFISQNFFTDENKEDLELIFRKKLFSSCLS